MKLLVTHLNYPSQFRRLVFSWSKDGHDVVFISRQKEWHSPIPEGFKLLFYDVPQRVLPSCSSHPYLSRLNTAIVEGQAVHRLANQLKDSGWHPDLIISHVGFGNGLFLKDCFPDALRVGLVEWFYNSYNSDVDYLHPNSVTEDHKLQLRIWNSEILLELSTLDHIVTPTNWQKRQFPSIIRDKIDVIHEGIDYNLLSKISSNSNFVRPSCLPVDDDIEVLTYVSRTFEEYRGFPQAAESISRLVQMRPKLHVIIVGQDGTSYGPASNSDYSSVKWAIDNFNMDHPRIHWLGLLQQNEYLSVLKVSDVHYYLTVPFILSWSLLEAMAVGCSLVASSTPPVLEVLQNDSTALLVDFFDIEQHVFALNYLFEDRLTALRLARNARLAASAYSSSVGLSSWNRILSGASTANC